MKKRMILIAALVFCLFMTACQGVAKKENTVFSVDDLAAGKTEIRLFSDLFYYSFRKNHPNVTRQQANKILFEEMGGMPEGMLERLAELYVQPYNALVQSEAAAKNSKWKVSL